MRLAGWLAVLTLWVAPTGAAAEVHPWAGLGSLVVPGVGQAAQGRYGAAAAHGGLWLGTGLGAAALAEDDD